MTRIDQFESVFKAAVKTVFKYESLRLDSGLVVTDLEPEAATAFGDRVRRFLEQLGLPSELRWRDVRGEEFRSAEDLLELVDRERPDLVCTYRTLHSSGWRFGHSLGEHVDVLTQVAKPPVLLLPHPESEELEPAFAAATGRSVVMAMTDHLTGDHRLVNCAALFTGSGGLLHLSNVEDRPTFERYMETISKISTIDTDETRELILEQLLKEPRDYIESCRRACEEEKIEIEIQEHVLLGEHLVEYKRLIRDTGAQLLVLNTKVADQLAMHGLAYPLAVELNHVPMLLL